MTKTLKARYDAEHNVLRLVEPLEGFANDADVEVTVETAAEAKVPGDEVERPWLALEGSLSREAGEELARNINELFPMWDAGSR
ncbi:MAG TPA: hypothetical protein VGR02_16625 [Thermoanaerobaculia bacterium]|jgi:hypothetical protein|nr:hypothetical protein [Thermoanaerobaculia bacterium]